MAFQLGVPRGLKKEHAVLGRLSCARLVPLGVIKIKYWM
jgi:hypothetical protein